MSDPAAYPISFRQHWEWPIERNAGEAELVSDRCHSIPGANAAVNHPCRPSSTTPWTITIHRAGAANQQRQKRRHATRICRPGQQLRRCLAPGRVRRGFLDQTSAAIGSAARARTKLTPDAG